MKINRKLLPVKGHWFFFMAASGPILPFLTVYGKQLGISEVMMGSITAVLPIFFLISKPIFGFLVDYFHQQRKILFILLICFMSSCYVLLYFVPQPPSPLQLVPDFNTTQEYGDKIDAANTTRYLSTSDNATQSIQAPTCEKATFYFFIALMSLSMVAYNVANSVSDAICFDVLGPGNEHKFGSQRVWGAIGFGLTALLGGLGMDLWSDGYVKNYTPAFILVAAFTLVDIIFCFKLELPKMGQSKQILKDVRWVLQQTKVTVFLLFTVMAGILESFIIYFMFWFLEDLSKITGHMSSIKIIEGLTVAAETLGGEVVFFPLSGKILSKLGHGHTFTLCFFLYALRLGLISFIPSPWWLIPVEFFMQGASYALCYVTIVAYASALAPPGTSATMQGIVAGVDDGVGFALGSLMGGFLYREIGGRMAFRLLSATAVVCGIAHALLYGLYLKYKDEPGPILHYSPPTEAIKVTEVAER